MAIVRSNSGLDDVIDAGHSIFHQQMTQMREVLAKCSFCRATFHEILVLFDCALADLGIQRSCINNPASEVAHGI